MIWRDFAAKLGSRKFLVSLFTIMDANIMLWYGKLDSSTFGMLMTGATAAYLVGQSLVDRKGGDA